ncbi:MAG: CDP-alcohol phosphatidyltransferase family protein [Candidatus Cloacimonetes bacterium]|nr:CDP-alcohol phosphatidyltransferase family protein [Candidatus Cloacimonadota bacterium]
MFKKFKEVNDFAKKTSAQRAIYSKFIVIPAANLIVSMVEKTKLTPNAATTISLLFGILMAASIVFISGYWGMFMAAIFYNFRLMWDVVDGTLARRKSMSSEKGSWWDQLVGKISTLLLLASLTYRVYPKSFWICVVVFLLFVYSSHRLITHTKKKYSTKKLLDKHSSFIANIYFEISRYHIFAVPFLFLNKPLWVIYGFGLVECIWVVKTLICMFGNLNQK